MTEPPRALRCAIYTRKSTEEGLQQEFNTLQAQREAGEACVLSQRASCWTVLPERYDDGGFSGASLERPALKELLNKIEAGAIDCVVVYKVDRLSRSLLDFARLMSLFDRHGVSFVSVTQEFNTTTSLGRLTLNILLSFAQFERELIGERTRDKLGAARRKGKWIGGIPVLGYDVAAKGGGLVVNVAEAERVREIFAIAAGSETLAEALQQVNARGLQTKEWSSEGGRLHAGQAFRAASLSALLGNVQYKGMVSHKGTLYPGEQEALISSELWDEVNRKLGRKGHSQRGRKHARQDALLLDLLRCGGCGSRIVPTFTTKLGQRYRYYACERAKRRECKQRPVAAQDLDVSVLRHMEPILGPTNTIAVQQSIANVTFSGVAREVCIGLRDGTRSSYTLPAVNRRGARGHVQAEVGRVPRISRIMALAIKLEQVVRERQAPTYAALAEAGHLSRARLSQIMTLANLAPSIQETVLLLPRRMSGPESVSEKQLRAIARQVDWTSQKKLFDGLVRRASR
jgi:DNA invertase Pin-like site-specific DNA recombinase